MQHFAVVDLKNQIKRKNDWLKLLVMIGIKKSEDVIDHCSYTHATRAAMKLKHEKLFFQALIS